MDKFLKQVIRQFRGESGIVLYEVLIAVALLGVVGVAIVEGLYTSNRNIGIIDEKSTARILITQHIESLRQMPYAANYTSVGDNITIPDQYTVVIEVEGSNDDVVWQTANGTETLQRIFVSVLREGRPVMRACTFRAVRERL
ncbi:hypothetical protein ACFLXG_01205 [Chloroflexota bacterium]